MSYFYSLRGWLEADYEGFPVITSKLISLRESYLENSPAKLYMGGWCWSSNEINFTRYIFYGADVREEGLDLLERTLDILQGLGCEFSGYFHAQGEDGERSNIYRILNGTWHIEAASTLTD